jgi:dTDP-4-amino-4,6-dideoxygalactose transaminase
MRAINSGWYILGKECEAFEAELAALVGTKEAVLCSSWTTGDLPMEDVDYDCDAILEFFGKK